jgi:hypothetical protein
MVLPVLVEVNSVEGPPQGRWTSADWEKLPDDGKHYEVIDGVLYFSRIPSTRILCWCWRNMPRSSEIGVFTAYRI